MYMYMYTSIKRMRKGERSNMYP
uniref:Uncharacterized protein n=1 Tax=Amphimedon queenslandica TaxID=400682 RepID=A0A1X7UQ29_AMPQE